jgi:TPR repeat protein
MFGNKEVGMRNPFEKGGSERAIEVLHTFAWSTDDRTYHSHLNLIRGRMYRYGEGVEKDYRRAERHLVAAAVGGNGWAKAELGKMHLEGIYPDSENHIDAYRWFHLAFEDRFLPAVEVLSELDQIMTPDQIEEAKRRAGEWKRSHMKRKPTS